MIVKNLMKRIGTKEFITAKGFADLFNYDVEKSYEILEQGVIKDVLFQTLTHTNKSLCEYGLREHIDEKNLSEFNDFIYKYFGEINDRTKFLDEEQTELKDQVLTFIISNRRNEATELLTNYILRENHIHTTRSDIKSEMWIYHDGVYKPEGKTFVKEFARFILGKAFTNHLCNEIIGKIEADTYISAEEFFNIEHINEIPINNGILNILTKEISPYTPKKIFFNKLNLDYDENAECPNIDKFFEDVLASKDDKKVIYELFGFCLYKEYFIEKGFMFVGNGRNGKGKTLDLLKRFLNPVNCKSLPLTALNYNNTALHELFGKLANIAGDLSKTALKESGCYKELTGRDYIQAKRKFLTDINFVNFAKMIFSANELPKVYDMSEGFWSRWVLLEFPYKFIKEKDYDKLGTEERKFCKIMDVDIINKISNSKEMSGLLNKALEGLARIKNDDFSYSKGTREIKDKWIRVSSPFTAFCFDCLEESNESFITKGEIRKSFNKYRKKLKVGGAGDKEIKATLEDLYGVYEEKINVCDERKYVWKGIKFRKKIDVQGVHGF